MIDLFNRKEVERALDVANEEFVMDWSNSIGPLSGIYRGKDGARELWTAFTDAWDEWSWEPQEVLELDDDRVLVVNRIRARGRGSGAHVDAVGVQVWTFRNGRATFVKLFQTKEEALKAG